jgi:hypothetical protein
MPEVAEAALSYILFILGGLSIFGGIMYLVKNSYVKKDKMAPTNGLSKVIYRSHVRYSRNR